MEGGQADCQLLLQPPGGGGEDGRGGRWECDLGYPGGRREHRLRVARGGRMGWLGGQEGYCHWWWDTPLILSR